MIDSFDDVIYGAQLLQKYYTADRIVIGHRVQQAPVREDHAAGGKGRARFEVASLRPCYPQAAEVLIYNTTGQIFPRQSWPIDVGAS